MRRPTTESLVAVAIAITCLSTKANGRTPDRLTRTEMVRALRRDGVLEGRKIDSVREVCRLRLGTQSYPVIATVERLTGIPEPRLYRHLIVLRPDLTKAYAFTYDLGVEPVRCGVDRVYFRGGPVLVNDKEGSVVQFANGAADALIAKE